MARPDKAAAVAELTEEFRSSNAVVLTEYRGLTVKQLTDLRRTLGGSASYAIVKNTLTKIAAKEAGVESLDTDLAGPSAIAFVKGDPVDAAKGLRDFARTHPALVIKGGVLDGKPLTADEIRRLADLESREVLLAKLAGAMKASLSGAVALFAAPLAQTARLVEALRQKAEADPSILAGGAGTAVSADTDAVSADTEAVSADTDAVSADPDAVSADTEASPADADVAPADADASPAEDTSTTESDAAPDEA